MRTDLRLLAATALVLLSLARTAVAAQFEDELLVLVNRYRSMKKLKPLAVSPLYTDLAREHSRTMQGQRSLGHDGFDERFRRAADARSCVENVGEGHETPQKLFSDWRTSPGHNRNMLDRKIRRAGIGRSGTYVTLFACY